MLMREVLNIFQADWASTPAMDELKPDCFKNKTVLISGHELALCLSFTLLMLNDRLKLGAKLVYASPDSGGDADIPEGLLERDDFACLELGHVKTLKQKADIIIHTGLCAHKTKDSMDEFAAETKAVKDLVSLASKKKTANIILLSDSRVYGKGANKYRSFSESEQGLSTPNDYSVQLMRTVESTMTKLCADNKMSLTIFRTGVVLAPGISLYNGLSDVFKAVYEGVEVSLYSTPDKLTFTYMSDITKALVYALEKKLEGLYNLSSLDSEASTGLIAAMLHDIFGAKAKIKMTDTGCFDGAELNCGKLSFAGFSPSVDLKTALELSVLSYSKNDETDFRFPDEHGGRLDAIQQVLLAYLLEVDRICKKHNIQWYLGGGTMLGAARHKGFIPWDDDVDIMMLREDYDKFLEVAPAELPEGMILNDPKKDKYYNYAYAKLRLTDTVFATDFSKNHKNMSNGFAFDIFCHDKTANSKIGQKIHSKLTLFWLAMVFNKWNHRKVYNGKKLESAISNLLKNIFPLRFSMRMLLFTLEMFKHRKNAKYLYDGMGKSVHKGGFDKSFVENEIRVDFCGYKMPVPARYKDYLKNHYGDFMEPAPLSTRIMGHDITLTDLNKYADFKISNKK